MFKLDASFGIWKKKSVIQSGSHSVSWKIQIVNSAFWLRLLLVCAYHSRHLASSLSLFHLQKSKQTPWPRRWCVRFRNPLTRLTMFRCHQSATIDTWQSDSEGSVALPSEVEDDNDWDTYMSARLSMDCDEANEQASGASVAMGRSEPPEMFADIFSRPCSHASHSIHWYFDWSWSWEHRSCSSWNHAKSRWWSWALLAPCFHKWCASNLEKWKRMTCKEDGKMQCVFWISRSRAYATCSTLVAFLLLNIPLERQVGRSLVFRNFCVYSTSRQLDFICADLAWRHPSVRNRFESIRKSTVFWPILLQFLNPLIRNCTSAKVLIHTTSSREATGSPFVQVVWTIS